MARTLMRVEVELIAEDRGRSGFGARTAAQQLHFSSPIATAVDHEGVEAGITVPI